MSGMELPKAESLLDDAFAPDDSGARQTAAEAELVAAACRGDERALEALYRSHHDTIYRYVWLRVGEQAAAEDVTAQVFLAMVDGLPRYRHKDRPFLAWLYGIARNQVAAFYRESSRRNGGCPDAAVGAARQEEPVAPFVPEADLEQREKRKRLDLALRALPEPQREVVLLRSLLDLSVTQTAELTGKSEGAVKQLHRRALASLRDRLGPLLSD
jgi:RNA polymerase sigma-70 factor, ECF subfamily